MLNHLWSEDLNSQQLFRTNTIEYCFEEEYWSTLPDPPSALPYEYGRVEEIKHMCFCSVLEPIAEQIDATEYFESLPERRDIAVVDEDFEEDFLQVVAARCKGRADRPHCGQEAYRRKIALEYDAKALYKYEFMLSFNRVVRDNGRIILQSGAEHAIRREHREKVQREAAAKRREEERKSVPKQDRFEERKRKREIADAMRIELQGPRELFTTAAAAVVGGFVVNFLHKGAKAADNISVLLEGLRNAKNQLLKLMGGLWFIPLVIVLHFFLRSWRNAFVASALCQFLPGFLPKGLFDHICHFFRLGDVQPQAGFEGYAALLSTMFTFSVFRGKMSAAKVAEFGKRIASFDRMAKGWDTLITCIMNGIETLINFVRKRFGKESIEIYTRSDKIVHEWAKEAEIFLRDEATGVEMDQDRLDGLLRCLQQGYEFKELYRGTEAGKLINSTVSQLGSITVSHLGAVASRNNSRFEPVTVFLYGQPGVGKTLMAVAFVTAVLLRSGLISPPYTPETVKSQMWQKGTSEFWQGYNRQKAIIMDDAFQNRAFAGDKDNDYFNIIKMVGCFSMPLNFADLASKGKIFFGSQLLFGSTNLSSINAEASIVIQEPEAVARRIGFGYQLFVEEEYQLDGKLDYTKFVAERAKCVADTASHGDPLRVFPWHMWYVQKHDFLTGRNTGPRLPLIDVIGLISDDIKNRLSSHDVAEACLDTMIGAFSASGVHVQAGKQLPKIGDLFKAAHLRKLIGEARKLYLSDCSAVQKFLTAASFIAGGFLAYKLVEAFFSGFCKLLSGLFPSNKPVVNSNRPLTKPVSQYGKRAVVQGGKLSTMADSVYANSYKMYNENTSMIFGQVLFLCEQMALQPQHFTETLRGAIERGTASLTDVICFRSCINEQNVHRFTAAQYLAFDRISKREHDVEFVKFTGLRAHRKIISAFVTNADLKFVSGRPVQLEICEIDADGAFLDYNIRARYTYEHVAKLGINGRNRVPLFIDGGRQMDDYYYYPSKRAVGDCGGILSLVDPKMFGGRCVLGVHCAGASGGVGAYANVITAEMIEAARTTLGVFDDLFLPDLASRGVKVQCGDDSPFSDMGSFMPIAKVEVPVFICPKTKYQKTALYEEGVYNSYPAILHSVVRDGQRTWPMENAVRPYSTPVLHYDVSRLSDIVHVAFKPFFTQTFDNNRLIYTFEEAVLGIPQEKFRSIPRGTAAGFPYVYDVTGGKKAFFGDQMNYDLTGAKCAELRERVSLILSEARRGVRLSHVYVDFLKDELRPIAKIEAVATRLISSAPLDYVIAWRMLFGSFSSAVMRHNVDVGMAPGISCYSDWPRVAACLQSKGSKVFDGDFKAFDSSEQPCIHDAILDAINKWYNDSADNQRARRVLWEDLTHSRHIGGRGDSQHFLYQWNKSLPSGHPFTTIVNSLYSLILLIACYFHLTGDMRRFWENVSPLTYGDDNVVNVDDNVVAVFNQVSVSKAMKELFNMVYTSGSKVGELVEFTDLASVTFLKRRFFCDRGRWLCPLELDSFLYTHFWCKNKKLERDILVDNLENALEELSLHPLEVWDSHAAHLAEVLQRHFGLLTRVCLERESYLSLVLSRVDEWY